MTRGIDAAVRVPGIPFGFTVDGKQHVTVGTGFAWTAGRFVRLTPELRPSAENNLFVFAFPE